ncbi:YlbE-like family protein [Priestia filamentosa]|uniref:YlbE-like family protein n=1 Tax=Priestia filamentosa TaxID=1402861 RepID=UPI000E76F1C9|nr:YlbE-like family protein [Priestia filamentosa]RJS66980.1 hypothetical protein CJ485_20580 [Priestia filamentosa]
MRQEVYEYIQAKDKLRDFIRQQPMWYRKLTRNPHVLNDFELASLNYYKQTIPHKVEKFYNSVEMANMMLAMFQATRSGD